MTRYCRWSGLLLAGAGLVWLAGSRTALAEGGKPEYSWFTLYATVGERQSDLGALSRTLEPYGYSSLDGVSHVFGFGVQATRTRVRLGIDIELPAERTTSASGGRIAVREVVGLVDLGYDLWENSRGSLYPYLGLGLDRFLLTAKRGELPLRGSNPALRPAVARDALGIELGLGLETLIPWTSWEVPGTRPMEKHSGLLLAGRIGYLFAAFPSRYAYLDAPAHKVIAPVVATGGYFIKLSVGWGLGEHQFGECARRCPARAHSRPWCSSGACLYDCEPGYGDCDREPMNGCEMPLDREDNCGECGTRCGPRTHGHTRCVDGEFGPACVITHCDPGYASCNGRSEDGCEVRLETDPNHCGDCGVRCSPQEQCVAGRCVGQSGKTEVR